MLSFRQKVFITYLSLFIAFTFLMFPFTKATVHRIIKKGMNDRANEVIGAISGAKNDSALIRKLKDLSEELFFRASVINESRLVLFDSHTRKLLGPKYEEEFLIHHPEVLQAFSTGTGYHEKFTALFSKEFAYFAKSFPFQGKTYVLRIAVPLRYMNQLSQDIEISLFFTALFVLLLFSAMTWFVMSYLTDPIQQIIDATKRYQEGLAGTIPDFELAISKRQDEFGKLARTLHSLSDTVKHQISTITREKNDKTAVLESLVEGVIALNGDNVINFSNPMANKLLNISPQKGPITLSASTHPEACQIIKLCRESRDVQTTMYSLKVDGQTRYLDLIAAPLSHQLNGVLLVIEDKTEQHQIDRMRKDFVANASHELKTPITIIQGFTETIYEHPDLPEEKQHEVMGIVVHHCKRMATLIEDLLTLSDIEDIPESRLTSCNLKEIAKQCIKTLQYTYPTAKIRTNFPREKQLCTYADKNLLEHALNNLLQNAAKYSPEPADICLEMRAKGDEIVIDVIDHGIGIPQEELKNIFIRFYRVDKSGSKKRGGSGLGLAIVSMIVAKLGGEISATSKLGKGSTFTLRLPRIRKNLSRQEKTSGGYKAV